MTQPETFYQDGRATLIRGNNLDALRSMADCSVDSIVTDPPYGLGKEPDALAMLRDWLDSGHHEVGGKGFMGREWDAFVPQPALWRECLRVLKPGGHLLSFAGTRTIDLVGLGLRIAGFEIRDTIRYMGDLHYPAWLYGCLSDDSEILTADGWKLGMDIQPGDLVMGWNSDQNILDLMPALDVYKAPYSGSLIKIANKHTDQLLTPNHRVYHRRKKSMGSPPNQVRYYPDQWIVGEAGEIWGEGNIQLPLSSQHSGPGIGGIDYAALLAWVWTEGGYDKGRDYVRLYQSSTNADHVERINQLLDRLGIPHKRYSRERPYKDRMYTEYSWFISGEWARKIRGDLPGKHPTYDLLWAMSQAEKQSFFDAAMMGDGGDHAFYQKDHADLEWMQALLACIERNGWIDANKHALGVAARQTTEMQAAQWANSGRLVAYDGNVWCVRVATGAFVARRAGKVFLTGNSGFPKNMDVAAAIDKHLKVTRLVKGQRKHAPKFNTFEMTGGKQKNTGYQRRLDERQTYTTTAATSPEAQQWDGWGTALKPAWEPVIVVRKPLAGTVAATVLAHGTGAINIAGCRIAGPSAGSRLNGGTKGGDGVYGDSASYDYTADPLGRWPANVIHDDSPAVLREFAAFGESVSGQPTNECGTGGIWSASSGKPAGPQHGDSGTAARFFYCAKASKQDRSEGLDGFAPRQYSHDGRQKPIENAYQRNASAAQNNHPTVKPTALMRYLVRLVTPPGGIVLDPFMGSGSTGKAAMLEGFRFIGIDLDMDGTYLSIAAGRIIHAQRVLAKMPAGMKRRKAEAIPAAQAAFALDA